MTARVYSNETVEDALCAGVGVDIDAVRITGMRAATRRRLERLACQLKATLQELPDDMTVAELRDELQDRHVADEVAS